jgi:hypothetical protein
MADTARQTAGGKILWHIAPVLLGDGIRLFDNPGGVPVRLELLNGDDPSAAANVRYHPIATG